MAKEGCFGVLCMLVIYCFGVLGALSEYVATGTEYTFKPGITGKIELFDWRHQNNLVVDWEPSTSITWYRFEKRARLNTATGELTLNLTKEDNGVFACHYQQGGIVKVNEITIKVIDAVPKPQVTCRQDGKNATLECSVTPSVQASFTWGGPNDLSSVGTSLQITRKQNDADTIYFCTANNEVSKQTAEVKLHICYQTPDHKTNVGAIVGAVIGVIALVVVVGIVAIYITRKRGGKTSAAKSDPDPNKRAQDPESSLPLTPQDAEK